MKVIKTDNCNMVYRGPEPGIGDMPCERRVMDGKGRTAIFATWKLNAEDRKAVAEGANVEVGLYYVEPNPPVYVGLTSRQEAAPPGPPCSCVPRSWDAPYGEMWGWGETADERANLESLLDSARPSDEQSGERKHG